MANRIVEFFGYAPDDYSSKARAARKQFRCPFIDDTCKKTLNDGSISGVCTIKPTRSSPVICCPYRLYSDQYKILQDVAERAFGDNVDLHPGKDARNVPAIPGRLRVAVFGKRWGKELRLPKRGPSGGYFVDWVLAKLSGNGALQEFVAIEVQSIDTTGNYQAERLAHLAESDFSGKTTAGLNWENVNKRILPQIIYKGHVLRQENRCRSGLFFVCPTPVYNKIRERLGGKLNKYTLQPGALTMLWYDIGPETNPGRKRELVLQGSFTTTVDQIALAFTSPSNLPDPDVYENAINAELLG